MKARGVRDEHRQEYCAPGLVMRIELGVGACERLVAFRWSRGILGVSSLLRAESDLNGACSMMIKTFRTLRSDFIEKCDNEVIFGPAGKAYRPSTLPK
jgi:hypothetical protein